MAASVAEVMPYWYVAVLDAELVAIIVWNVVELGFWKRASIELDPGRANLANALESESSAAIRRLRG